MLVLSPSPHWERGWGGEGLEGTDHLLKDPSKS